MKFIDLTGRRFGKLTVVERVGDTGSTWLCKCDCGREKKILGSNLRQGYTTSCGHCCKTEDITGNRYGRLVVTKMIYAPHASKCVCMCDCGNETTVLATSLKSGFTKSCGCLQKEKASVTGKQTATHGKSKSRLYRVWRSMKTRTENPKAEKYPIYGGRGIAVCEEWRNSYKAFEKWALENGYDESAPFGKCTIDRIDVDGNYCPSNCRWVDLTAQANNRRNGHGREIL